MKKHSILLKRLTRVGGLSLMVVCASVVLYTMLDSAAEEKAAELSRKRTDLSFKQTEVNTFTNQLENSKGAQAEFAKYLLTRNNQQFAVDVDSVKVLLNQLRDQLGLGQDLRLTLSSELPLNDSKLSALPHTILWREGTKLSITALTDLHIYTFVEALTRRLPGLMQITGLRVSRKGQGLDPRTLAMIGSGNRLDLAEAEVTFNWYNIQRKAEEKTK